MHLRASWLIVPLFSPLLVSVPTRAAIYADFTVPQGTFTVELDALRAPRAVATFMGLADGTQTWRDPVTGEVRGGALGDAFYDEMPFYSVMGGYALLGGMRSYTGGDGREYWEGPGYTILDEATNGVDLVHGVLALAEFEGPHSGGGELAILLTNAPYLPSGWTGFGTVTGGGMAVVQAMANVVTGGSGRVLAQIAIRDAGMTSAESAALNAARGELPIVEAMPMGFNRDSHLMIGASFWSTARSRACLSTRSNLATGSWSVLPGDWNPGTNSLWREVPMASIPGTGSQRGFLYGSQAIYPKLTAVLLSNRHRIAMGHTGMDMQYWLDFTAATGMWARVSNNVPVENGPIDWIGQEMGTANSLHMVFFIGWTAYHYWMGLDEAEAVTGRFYCELWYMNTEWTGTDSGTYVREDGWGGKDATRRWTTIGTSKTVPHVPMSREIMPDKMNWKRRRPMPSWIASDGGH